MEEADFKKVFDSNPELKANIDYLENDKTKYTIHIIDHAKGAYSFSEIYDAWKYVMRDKIKTTKELENSLQRLVNWEILRRWIQKLADGLRKENYHIKEETIESECSEKAPYGFLFIPLDLGDGLFIFLTLKGVVSCVTENTLVEVMTYAMQKKDVKKEMKKITDIDVKYLEKRIEDALADN